VRVSSRNGMTTIRNFGKNVVFEPARVASPKSAEELAALVRGARKVRVMGSRHSWSDAIVTDDTLISLDEMRQILHVDKEKRVARVQAGIKLKELIAGLEAEGMALGNLGSISQQSIAGAISTGTHGSGIEFQCLASQVESLRLIDGEGGDRRYDRGDPHFDAVVVGLGSFGVVYELTLRVVPTFQMHAITDTAPWGDVLARLDTYVRGHDHFKLWWLPPGDDVILFQNDRTDEPRNDSDLQRWVKDELVAVIAYRALLALGKLNRRSFIPRINRVLTKTVSARFERICKSHVGFLTPVPPVHREGEWAFDYKDAPRILGAYRKMILESGHTFNFIQEVRFTKADPFWLSPGYGRDTMWLSLYNIDSDARWEQQLFLVDAFAKEHGGRPHWGKEAHFDHAYLASQYPKLGEARALMRVHDPEGKLTNAWISRLFGDL
jgi:FAD/FMN-containing dehydrogenase